MATHNDRNEAIIDMPERRNGPRMTGTESIARGAVATLTGQAIRLLVQMAGLAILARILSPTDYGQLAMIMSVVGVAAVLGDFGLSLAAVQSNTISNEQRSNLFWVNSIIGFATAIMVCLIASPIARFFDEPALAPATMALSSVFLANGMASQYRADLNRAKRYSALAATDVIAQIAGLSIGIFGAINELGFWALVTQQISVAIATLTVLIVYSKWVPALPQRSVSLHKFLRFGAATSATQLINYLSSNVDSVAIGNSLGSAQLGVYNRGFQLFMLPLQQIAAPMVRVALPVLSQMKDPRDHFRYLQRANMLIAYILVGALLLLGALAKPIVLLVLGSRWIEAIGILQILTIGGVFQALGYVYYWAFLSRAQMRILLVCEGIGRTPMIVLIVIASHHGIHWVAAAYSVGLFLTWITTGMLGLPRIGISYIELTRVSIRPVILWTTVSVLIHLVLRISFVSQLSSLIQIAIGIALTASVCGAALALAGYRVDAKAVLGFWRAAVRRQTAVEAA